MVTIMRVISRGEGVEAASGQAGRFWHSRKRKGYDIMIILFRSLNNPSGGPILEKR